jgi:TolB-like protein/class 3 adenylate cyclase/tetratricopeptide (TPR) repeat protein
VDQRYSEASLTGERVERRLAAVLAADVAGYSRLMGRDEERTLANLKSLRKTHVDPAIAAHRGRIVKTTGDGLLLEFSSAVDAARFAVEVQRGMAKQNSEVPQDVKIEFRIGIHVGDIIIDDNDIFGDGVNIAARLEGIAEPGGVCISDDAQRQIRGKVDIAFDDMGVQRLKNIAEPMRAWRLQIDKNSPSTSPKKAAAEIERPLALPNKPSIAVLPFQNMSGDPEQEYFADGMVEDIITALSRFKSLFVIARNSSFTFKGKAVDIKQVGRELGVRYVLEGSVRKSGARLRITGQLIDAATGAHLWADKFEGDLHEVFDLQDEVATSVVGAIAPRLIQADVERAKRKSPESWDSYDLYLRGIALFVQRTPETTHQALELFRKAIGLDPEFALAHIRAAACLFMKRQDGGRPLTGAERSEALRLTNRAMALSGDDELVLGWASLIFAFLNDEIERGSDLSDRALAINSNFSNGWNARGWISTSLGDGARALDAFDRAIRLNPADDYTVVVAMQGKCAALWVLDRHADALEMADRLLARRPNDLRGLVFKFVAAPDLTRAADAADHIRAVYPHLRSSHLREMFLSPTRSPRHRAMIGEAIARIGLPE